ncbi:MAG: chromate transporter [Clostridia bacterium]|nr:chromate transporter [Clostridia bacterium]
MTFLKLFWSFFKTSLFSFGGGYAMIPMVKQEVLAHGWITESAILDFIGISESTPGPFIINLATFVGNQVGTAELGVFGGILGALVATFAVMLPSFIIILLIATLLKKIINNKYVQGALNAMLAIIVGLILATGISIAFNVLFPAVSGKLTFNYLSLIIAGIIIVVKILVEKLLKKRFSPILLIILSAVLGIIFF